MQQYAIIVAGGKGSRMQSDLPKQFIEVQGKPLLMYTLQQFYRSNPSIQIILVLPANQQAFWHELLAQYQFNIPHRVVGGGASRFQSVRNGLNAIQATEGVVAIHDGVRPFIATSIIQLAFQEAIQKGNAIVSMPLKDSIRHVTVEGNKAMPRKDFRIIQTPQTFQLALIKAAFEVGELAIFTDDATVLEHAGHEINLIDGDYRNIKITTVGQYHFDNHRNKNRRLCTFAQMSYVGRDD